MDVPSLLAEYDEDYLAERVVVLREAQRAARSMEYDEQITALRTPRVLKEIYRTLKILAADRASWGAFNSTRTSTPKFWF